MMLTCTICGEPLRPDQKACEICGTSVPDSIAPPIAASHVSPPPLPPLAGVSSAPMSGSISAATRICPVCRQKYSDDYQDEFCACGGELVRTSTEIEERVDPPSAGLSSTATSTVAPASLVQPLEQLPSQTPDQTLVGPSDETIEFPVVQQLGPIAPPSGSICLVVYSVDKHPIHYCVLDKDVTLVGRNDPVRGHFPDLDLSDLFDESVARKISRRHIMILRSRATGTYVLRPLGGNTGTQIERELANPLQDYPLTPGTRIILGGVVRLKYDHIP